MEDRRCKLDCWAVWSWLGSLSRGGRSGSPAAGLSVVAGHCASLVASLAGCQRCRSAREP